MKFDPKKTPWLVSDGRVGWFFYQTQGEAVMALEQLVEEGKKEIVDDKAPAWMDRAYVLLITHLVDNTDLPEFVVVEKVGVHVTVEGVILS